MGSEKRQRGLVIKVRVTETERNRIRSHAEAAGRKEVATYLRDLGLAGLDVPGTQQRWAAVRAVSGVGAQLGRVGNNLNQLAHEANAGRFPSAERLAAELEALAQLRDQLARLIDEL